MTVELHLPDLPEVPLALGPVRLGPAARAPTPWHLRLRETLASLLPLLLMLLLALASWWLVKNSPRPLGPAAAEVPLSGPDYTMARFTMERFGPDGRLRLALSGEQLRHYPDGDRIEVDAVRIRAVAEDGRVTLAQARRANAKADGSEVELLGGAEVDSTDAAGRPMRIESEYLHALLDAQRVRTDRPVRVRLGSDELRAAGLEYDHAAQRLDLRGPMRAVLPARAGGSGGPR